MEESREKATTTSIPSKPPSKHYSILAIGSLCTTLLFIAISRHYLTEVDLYPLGARKILYLSQIMAALSLLASISFGSIALMQTQHSFFRVFAVGLILTPFILLIGAILFDLNLSLALFNQTDYGPRCIRSSISEDFFTHRGQC